MMTRCRAAAALMLVVGLCSLEAQVEVIRRPPQTGVTRGSATWREAYPDPGSVRATGVPDAAGRLSAGGRAGQTAEGAARYDAVTDSRVTLVQPLGGAAVATVEAVALRVSAIEEREQEYSGSAELRLERGSIEVTGGYEETLESVAGTERREADAFVGAALEVALLPTLPASLVYRSSWAEEAQAGTTTDSDRADEARFRAAGTLGDAGISASGTASRDLDTVAGTSTVGVAGEAIVAVPLLESVTVRVRAMPAAGWAPVEGGTREERRVEAGAGLTWTFSEDGSSSVSGSRTDAWSREREDAAFVHESAWRGEIGVAYEPAAGLFAAPSYRLTATADGGTVHAPGLSLGWRGTRAIRELAAGATAALDRSPGAQPDDTLRWTANLVLAPIGEMRIVADYAGSLERDAAGDRTAHKSRGVLTHSPLPYLDYRASYAFAGKPQNGSSTLRQQEYALATTLKAARDRRISVVGLSETVAVSTGGGADAVLSTAVADFAVPVLANATAQGGVRWEWISHTAPGAGPGSNLAYSLGGSVAGAESAVDFSGEYVFSHGYRGIRHDVEARLAVPLRHGFALEALFTLSSRGATEDVVPFLLGANLVYEF